MNEDNVLRTIRASTVIPLARAMLCVACESIYVVNGPCPSCASTMSIPVARWIKQSEQRPTDHVR